MRILLTRPKSDCDDISEHLEAAGHDVICSPMLEIEFLPCPRVEAVSLQAIIITSANALRSMERDGQISHLVDVPVYTVGAASGRLARAMGFAQVVSGHAGAREIITLITEHLAPAGGQLLHLSGEVLAVDLESALTPLGYELTRVVVYRTEPVVSLRRHATEVLEAGSFDLVILMSPRSARTFAGLVFDAGLTAMAQRLDYACISETTANELRSLQLPQSHLHVPSRPQTDNLLALVNGLVNRISPQ